MSYDQTTIRFHWVSAALIAALWLLGQTADWFPRGVLRGAVWSTHFTLGFLLIAVYAARIVWRLTGGRKLPALGSGAMRALAAAGHGVLYLLIGAVLALGIGNLYAHGSNLWGLVTFARMEESPLRHNIGEAHEWAANLLLLLALAHAAVAAVHQYVWGDGALARMVPRLAQ